MTDFSDILENIESLDRLTQMSKLESNQLGLASYPQDYVDFMHQIGFGNLGSLQIYNAPINPESVYPAHVQQLKTVVLFGDDFQGYCFGFDIADGMRVVEINPRGDVDKSVELSLKLFIRTHFS